MALSPAGKLAVGFGVIAIAVGAVTLIRSNSNIKSGQSGSTSSFRAAPPTGPKFGETTIAVGTERLQVQVADTLEERARGLMYRDTIAPYRGMLFVFESDNDGAFTMSNTRIPLSIGFYRTDGTRVSEVAMAPCPDTPQRCPVYHSFGTYRYALETAQGQLPGGRLRLHPVQAAAGY